MDDPKTLNIATAHFGSELKRRIPWMFVGLLAGISMVGIGRNFQDTLAQNIEFVLFLPMIVYMSDNIGTETLALFVRELAFRRVHLGKLLWREAGIGCSLGLLTGIPMGIFSYTWLRDTRLSLAIAIAMTVNGVMAVLIGMITPVVFATMKRDPALGTEGIATALSDNASMLVYLLVAMVALSIAS